MALADLDNVKKRVIRILNANTGAWANTVSGSNVFPDDSEITAAILEADEMVVTKGYFQSRNAALSEPFMTLSANIPSGSKIPFFYGHHGQVFYSTDNSNFFPAVRAKSAADIFNNQSFLTSYLGTSDARDHLYYIDEKGNFYHVATYGKIELPVFTRTSALQARQSEETLVVATAIRLLTKHAAPAAFDSWTKESIAGIQQLIADGAYTEQEN